MGPIAPVRAAISGPAMFHRGGSSGAAAGLVAVGTGDAGRSPRARTASAAIPFRLALRAAVPALPASVGLGGAHA